MMITSCNITVGYQTLKDDCDCYHRGQQFTLEVTEKVWSYFYVRIPMLFRMDLVSTSKITYIEMGVIWPQMTTVKIRS